MAEVTRLRLADLPADPLRLFRRWYDAAVAADPATADAMALATADAGGRPSLRTVVLQAFDGAGFVFFSCHTSRKGRDLAANPAAALLLYWPETQRQVRIAGRVQRLAPAEADDAFAGRPRGEQLSLTASPQGELVADRAELEGRLAAAEQAFRGRDVPRPAAWGGYRLRPDEFQFWQQGEGWLNDVFRYRRAAGGEWTVERLAP